MRFGMPLLVLVSAGCGRAAPPAALRTNIGATEMGAAAAGGEAPAARPSEVTAIRWEVERDESFERAVRTSVASACGDDVAAAAVELEIEEVTSCAVSVYSHRGQAERLLVVTLHHGPIQDCESGCFQDSTSAIVRGDHVSGVPTPRVAFGSPYSFVTDHLRRELASRSLRVQNALGHWYDFFMHDGFCANYHDRVALETWGDAVYWAIDLPPTVCTPRLPGPGGERAPYDVRLHGTIVVPIVPAEGTYPRPDFRRLTLSVEPVAAP